MLARFGVRTTFFDPQIAADGPGGLAELIEDETRVIYLESPGSYTFEIQDVPAICATGARTRHHHDARQHLCLAVHGAARSTGAWT